MRAGLHRRGAFRGGGGGGSAPAFDAEYARWFQVSSQDPSTGIMRPSSTIAAGKTAIAVVNWISGSQSINTLQDDQGNTWARAVAKADGSNQTEIWYSILSTALGTTDDVEVDWTAPGFTYRWGVLLAATDVSGVDVTASGGTFGSDLSVTGTTTVADTLIVGAWYYEPETVSSPTWSVIGAEHSPSGPGREVTYFQGQEASAGAKDSGGTLGGTKSWHGCWAAFK